MGGEAAPTSACYLVEWYAAEVAGQPLELTVQRLSRCLADRGLPRVELLATVAVPADDMVLALFGADSAAAVTDVCGRAGLPAQRLTAAVHAFPQNSRLRPGSD